MRSIWDTIFVIAFSLMLFVCGFLLGMLEATKCIKTYLAESLCVKTSDYFVYKNKSIDEWVKVLEIKK